MASMFKGALLFDQDIQTQTDKWNTVAVKDMSNMFNGAAAFGAASNGKAGITNWNTAAVTTMASMFEGTAKFNKHITNWNTKLVESMASMFKCALLFDQDIKTQTDKWNTVAVKDMSNMFNGAAAFGAASNGKAMFKDAKKFNQNIANWDITDVTANG